MVPENIIQLGYEPYHIDLLVDFEGCYERRLDAELDGIAVKFISRSDLITAKKKAGRLQDLADAEQLEKLEKKKKE